MNKPTKTLGHSTYMVLCAVCLLSVSCADDEYDLSDIDLTIKTGGDELVIPTSDTKEITLKDLLDIKDGDIVQPDGEGNYVLSQKSENPINSTISVDNTTISNCESQNAAQNFFLPPLPQLTFKYTIGLPNVNSDFTINKRDMPQELVSLTNLKVDANFTVTVKINGLTGDALFAKSKGVTIMFPSYLKSEQLVNGVFKIPENADLIKGYTAKIKVTQIAGFGVSYNQSTKLYYQSQNFLATGRISVMGSSEIIGNGFQVTSNNPKLSLNVHISPIKVLEATGIIDPNKKFEDQEIAITNLPDFLKDEDVVFDASNPQINLEINNESPLNTTFYGKLVAIKDGQETAEVNLTCEVLASTFNKVCFSRIGRGGAAGYTNIAVPGLNKLLRTIPDKIVLRSNIKTTRGISTFKLGESHPIVTTYSLVIPLALGPKMKLIYNENYFNWSKDLKDIEISSLKVYMTAVNKMPLSLQITATAIDTSGQEIPDVEVVVDDSTSITALTNTQLSISINCAPETMKLIDGLMMRVVATSPKDSGIKTYVLNANQTLKFTDVKIKVFGGITADLN